MFRCTTVNGAEWVYYAASPDGEFYYDKESITSGGKGIIKVWDKTVYSEKWKQDYIRWRKEKGIYDTKFEDLSYTINLYVMRCSTREFDIIFGSHRNREEKIIDSYSNPSPSYDPISPASIMESLYKIVCNVKEI